MGFESRLRRLAVPLAVSTGLGMVEGAVNNSAEAKTPESTTSVASERLEIQKLKQEKATALRQKQELVNATFEGANIKLEMQNTVDIKPDHLECYTIKVDGANLGEVRSTETSTGSVEFVPFLTDDIFLMAVKDKLDAAEIKYNFTSTRTVSAVAVERAMENMHEISLSPSADDLMKSWGGQGLSGEREWLLGTGLMSLDVTGKTGDEFDFGELVQKLAIATVDSHTLVIKVTNKDKTQDVMLMSDGKIVSETRIPKTNP